MGRCILAPTRGALYFLIAVRPPLSWHGGGFASGQSLPRTQHLRRQWSLSSGPLTHLTLCV